MDDGFAFNMFKLGTILLLQIKCRDFWNAIRGLYEQGKTQGLKQLFSCREIRAKQKKQIDGKFREAIYC